MQKMLMPIKHSGMGLMKSPPPVRKAFAKRLQTLRVRAGYKTARDFALAMGIKEGTYARWERAETEPSFSHLMLICQLLRAEPNDFFMNRRGSASE